MSNIIFKNVTKAYSAEYGLIDFDCEIKSGEFVTVIGPSGSGKTTFLKLISGLSTCDCGEIYVDNELVNEKAAKKRNIAMMFQEYTLYPNYNVYENVGAYLKFNNYSVEEIHTKVMNALKLFKIENLANRRIKELSGGQKQKVALTKLFVREPKVILFDEPLSNIDEEKKNEYRQNILALKELLPNTTFVYVTHNLTDALTLGERVLFIESGRNIAFIKPDKLIYYPPCLSLIETLTGNHMMEESVDIDKFDSFYLESINNKDEIKQSIIYNKKHLGYNEQNRLVGGACEKIKLNGYLDRGVIKFNNFTITLNAQLCSRLLVNKGNVEVIFDIRKLHKNRYSNDTSLEIEFIKSNGHYSLFMIDGNKFITNSEFDIFDKEMFYDINDIQIETQGNKVLANYIIYPNILETIIKKNKVYVNKSHIEVDGCLNLNIPLDGVLNITNKKGVNKIKINVISEEIINDEMKLIYATVMGAKHYITFYINKNIKINYNKKQYIELDIRKFRR